MRKVIIWFLICLFLAIYAKTQDMVLGDKTAILTK